MPSFKTFLLESANEKFNIGNSMEGVFALAVGLYIAYRKIEISKLKGLINSITLKKDEEIVVDIVDHMERSSAVMSDVEDAAEKDGDINVDDIDTKNANLAVKVILNLVYGKTWEGFGEPKGRLIGQREDLQKYETYIENLVNQVESKRLNHVIDKIDNFIAEVLTKKEKQDVNFLVIADGKDNSTEKGKEDYHVKGDISLKIQVETKSGEQIIDVAPLIFSLKVDNKTFAALAIFNGILRIANSFGVDEFIRGISELKTLPQLKDSGNEMSEFVKEKDPTGELRKDKNHIFYWMLESEKLSSQGLSKDKFLKDEMITHFMGMLKEKTASLSDAENIKNAFIFLHNEIHGKDEADVIKLSLKSDTKFLKAGNLRKIAEFMISRGYGFETGFDKINFDVKEGQVLEHIMTINGEGVAGAAKSIDTIDIKKMLDTQSSFEQLEEANENSESNTFRFNLNYKLTFQRDGKKVKEDRDIILDAGRGLGRVDENDLENYGSLVSVKNFKAAKKMYYLYRDKKEYHIFVRKQEEEYSGSPSEKEGYINFYTIDLDDDKNKIFHIRMYKNRFLLEVEDYIYDHPAID